MPPVTARILPEDLEGEEDLRRLNSVAFAVALLAASAGAPSLLHAAEPVPPAADRPWVPPPELVPPVPAPTPSPALAAAAAAAAAGGPLILAGHQLPNGLLDLPLAVDLALANSPQTRETWLAA